MEAIIIDDVVVNINKDFSYRVKNHPVGEYSPAGLALHIPQSMNGEILTEWLEKNKVALKRYKKDYLQSLEKE